MIFNTREVAVIAMFASLWGVLNSVFSPIIFQLIGLPILCDLIGFTTLILTVWWIRKFGAITVVGIIATVINFIFNPGGIHFLGFTAASIVFDLTTRLIGHERCFKNAVFTLITMLSISVLSAAIAGTLIGTFFLIAPALARWGGVLGWAALHAMGGAIGGVLGIILVTGLEARSIHRIEVKQ